MTDDANQGQAYVPQLLVSIKGTREMQQVPPPSLQLHTPGHDYQF
jgi:hypothetical protein